jgi:site-specific DNA-methyltransferase (adenine-specific)
MRRQIEQSPKAMKFEIGQQQLFLNKWESVLPTIPSRSVDLLLTDPPYATTGIKWDKAVDLKSLWEEINRVCKPTAAMVVFASGKFVPVMINSNLSNYRYELIWEKFNAVGHLDANRRPMRAHEQMLVFCRQWKSSTYNPQKTAGKPHKTGGDNKKPVHYKGKSRATAEVVTDLYHPRSVLKFDSRIGGASRHPTAKPLELVTWLVKSYSNRGDVVLDPFCGSGTTLAATLLTNRRGIGCEISEDYFTNAGEWLKTIDAEINPK